jgi:hypothetical protein
MYVQLPLCFKRLACYVTLACISDKTIRSLALSQLAALLAFTFVTLPSRHVRGLLSSHWFL